jgi:hypothetical protein
VGFEPTSSEALFLPFAIEKMIKYSQINSGDLKEKLYTANLFKLNSHEIAPSGWTQLTVTSKLVTLLTVSLTVYQGCQIFLGPNIPKRKKYTKLPQTI